MRIHYTHSTVLYFARDFQEGVTIVCIGVCTGGHQVCPTPLLSRTCPIIVQCAGLWPCTLTTITAAKDTQWCIPRSVYFTTITPESQAPKTGWCEQHVVASCSHPLWSLFSSRLDQRKGEELQWYLAPPNGEPYACLWLYNMKHYFIYRYSIYLVSTVYAS